MNRILAFVLACAAIVGIVFGVIHFASLDETQHKIEYMVEGEIYHSQSAFVNAEIILPANPTRTGYDFDGWYYDDNSFNKKFDVTALEGDRFSESIKVYAKWVPHVHKLDGKLTRKEDGKIEFTAVCKGCGKSFTEPDAKVQTNITKTATCLETGEITYSFTYLGQSFTLKQGIAKIGHMLNGTPISEFLNDKGQISIDQPGVSPIDVTVTELSCGGTAAAVYVCSTCNRSINITAIKAHDFLSENATLELLQMNPGASEYYVVNAKCGRAECGFTANFEAEKECIKTTKIVTSATCSVNGAKIVTYTNPNSVIGNITVSTADSGDDMAIIPAHGFHRITGRADKYAKEYQNPDGTFNYYAEDGTRMFQTDFAGTDINSINCETEFESYYICTTCPSDNNKVSVRVVKNHNYETLEYTAPTCVAPGYLKQKCLNCQFENEPEVPVLPHTIEYVLKVNPDGDNIYTNDSFIFSIECAKCSYVSYSHEYEYNDTALSRVTTKATCGVNGSIVTTIKYTLSDKTVKTVTCTQVIPATGKHILNGNIASETYANADGTYNLTVDGIKLSASNFETYICTYYTGVTQPGYFECEYCKENGDNCVVYVDVCVNHTGDWKITTPATCSATGNKHLDNCNQCGAADDTTFDVTIPATGNHVYKYELKFVEGNSFNLITTCWYDHCGYKKVELVTPTKTLYKTATCSEKGIYRYTYDKNGEEVICDIEYVDVHCHRINGQYIIVDNTSVLPSNMPGIIMPEVYDHIPGSIVQAGFICEDCGRYIIVNVKIVE
ncbi:MAG: InlB B-repeat-containing protein [Clostridia bacterium]|nr:InlB B-repeat-containing protein [Clostridia bacterium]